MSPRAWILGSTNHGIGPPDLDLDAYGRPGRPVIVLDADDIPPARDRDMPLSRPLPIVVLVAEHGPVAPRLAAAADLIVAAPGLCSAAVESAAPQTAAAAFAEAVRRSPTAALTLAWLLRARLYQSVAAGLAAESAAYSTLLGGHEFRSWLSRRPPPRDPDDNNRVRVERSGNLLQITLARPARRNAVDVMMRQALAEALSIAAIDPSLRVRVDAEGPAFSAGGDLDEFGTATDMAAAHVVRVAGSVGQLVHDMRDRIDVRVHGACVGAGIELTAFAGHIVAASDSSFALPEVAMGLIPGAGGTVSIPARVGASRALWLAISGERLPARTALAWGLIDAIE